MEIEIIKINLENLENERQQIKNKILNQFSKNIVNYQTLLDLIEIDVKVKVLRQVLV